MYGCICWVPSVVVSVGVLTMVVSVGFPSMSVSAGLLSLVVSVGVPSIGYIRMFSNYLI